MLDVEHHFPVVLVKALLQNKQIVKGDKCMAKAIARILPSLEEKRYITLQFLEGAFMSGTKVKITPVKTYNISDLSKEIYTYDEPIECYIIYNERPKVSLLKQFGWYRDNQEGPLPQVAQIATHLLYKKPEPFVPPVYETVEEEVEAFELAHVEALALTVETVVIADRAIVQSALLAYEYLTEEAREILEQEKDLLDLVLAEIIEQELDAEVEPVLPVVPQPEIIHDVQILGNEMRALVKTGESSKYILQPINIRRGTIIDVFYDFAPERENRFIVVDPFIDTISINYTCNIMPYRYEKTTEVPEEDDARKNSNKWLNFDATKHDL
jgi:hypothetical protein